MWIKVCRRPAAKFNDNVLRTLCTYRGFNISQRSLGLSYLTLCRRPVEMLRKMIQELEGGPLKSKTNLRKKKKEKKKSSAHVYESYQVLFSESCCFRIVQCSNFLKTFLPLLEGLLQL